MKQTWLDRVLNQKVLLYTFVVVVTLSVTLHLWSSDKICSPGSFKKKNKY